MKRFVVVGSSLFALACDSGRDVTTATVPGAADPAPISVRRADLRRADVLSARPSVAPSKGPSDLGDVRATPHLRRPLDGSGLDNVSCEAAVALPDDGARAVPMEGGAGTGCLAGAQRFFKLTIGPGEVVTVKNPGSPVTRAWMAAAPACDAIPDAVSACGSDWASLEGGIALANTGDAPVERFIGVVATPSPGFDTFDLRVTRTRIAPHSRCEDARALPADGLHGERMSRAGVTPTDASHWFSRTLYYQVEIPPMTRVSASLQAGSTLGLTVLDDCADETPSFYPELANATDAPLTGIVEVGAQWQVEDRFDLGLAFEPLGADASCESPRALAAGDTVTFDIQGGGSGPSTCWCLAPRRVAFVDLTVPAGGGLVASAITSVDSGAQLIEVPEACADACGDQFASGWGEMPAELVLTNDGTADAVRHFIVTSNEVWSADGTGSTFPPVTVTVKPAE